MIVVTFVRLVRKTRRTERAYHHKRRNRSMLSLFLQLVTTLAKTTQWL